MKMLEDKTSLLKNFYPDQLIFSRANPYVFIIFALAGFFILSRINFLLFHGLAELFSVVVAFGLFIVIWNSRHFLNNNYLLFLGIAFFSVAFLDVIYILAYDGKTVFDGGGNNLAAQLWIGARFLQAISFVLAPLFFRRKLNVKFAFLGYFIFTAVLLLSVFYFQLFPDTYMQGSRLTLFKEIGEYIISLLFFIALFWLARHRDDFDNNVWKLLSFSLLTSAFSEMAFAAYADSYGIINTSGHLLKILAFYLLYRAVISSALIRPYDTIFRDLKKNTENLKGFVMAMEQSPAMVIIANREGDIDYVNPHFTKVTGYSLKEIIGQNPRILKSGETSNKDYRRLWNTLLAGGEWHGEFHNKKKDDTFYWTVGSISPVKDETGKITNFIAIQEDITQKKLAEEKMKQYAEELKKEKAEDEAILSSIGDGMIAIDTNLKILFTNKAFEKLSGYKKKELELMPCSKHLILEDKKNQPIECKDCPVFITLKAAGRPDPSTVYHLLRKDGGRIPVKITANQIIFNGKVTGAIAVFRDVTQEVEINKAKIEFVSVASHQLRTPLTSISLGTEMLLSGIAGKLNPEQDKYLRNMHETIKSMTDLINELLNITRIELGTLVMKPEPTDLVRFTDGLLKEMSLEIKEKRLKLIRNYENNLPVINLDHNLMRLVLENLLSNAVKYNYNGGKVALEIKRKEQDVLIKIEDTGCGIPKHQQPLIFTKDFRADGKLKEKTQGSGLGLYIVRSAVEHYGGNVWFESEEDAGTRFYVTVPALGMVGKEQN